MPTFEAVAAATVEARIFLARVRPRRLKTDAGREVSTMELAQGLVRRAALEHAVIEGVRPTEIVCQDCAAIVKVKPQGVVPKRCGPCAVREGNAASYRRYRAKWEAHPARLARLARKGVFPEIDREAANTIAVVLAAKGGPS